MGKPRAEISSGKSRAWEPTLTQIAERANTLWHEDGCPSVSELGYWLRARTELKQEYHRLVTIEEATDRAVIGIAEDYRSRPGMAAARRSRRV